MNTDLINEYERAGEKLALAIRGLTRDDLLAVPIPGKWSTQQVVIHLMDSELISTDRMKRMIAEDNPTLIGYDETRFSQNLFYNDQPAETAVQIIDLNRKLFTTVLRKLSPAAWSRKGAHNERGEITLGSYLKAVMDHLDHHLKFIHEKRKAMGKEMW